MASNTPSSSRSQPRPRVDRFASKPVLIPKKVVDIPLLTKYGIIDIFDCQGWRGLLTDDKPVFPWLVRQFYTNLTFSPNTRVLKSFVNWKEIVLDEAILARILSIPCEGWGIQSNTSWSTYPIPPLEQTRIIMANDTLNEAFIPGVNQLPAFSRVIQHLCISNVFPRHPTQYRINCPEMFIISMMLAKKPINLPGSMITFMDYVATKELSLPYGGILTRVFEYMGVDLTRTEIYLRPSFPSTFLDNMYFITMDGEAQNKPQGEQLVEASGVMEVHPTCVVNTEDSTPFQDQNEDEPPNAHSLEDIYQLLQDTNNRLANMEQQMLLMQNQQAQNTQFLNDVINAFISVLPTT